jgi:hypothetical protein
LRKALSTAIEMPRWVAQRVLSNFIGDGAVANKQTDSAQVVLKYQDGRTARTIDAGSTVRVHWDPIYYLDPC